MALADGFAGGFKVGGGEGDGVGGVAGLFVDAGELGDGGLAAGEGLQEQGFDLAMMPPRPEAADGLTGQLVVGGDDVRTAVDLIGGQGTIVSGAAGRQLAALASELQQQPEHAECHRKGGSEGECGRSGGEIETGAGRVRGFAGFAGRRGLCRGGWFRSLGL